MFNVQMIAGNIAAVELQRMALEDFADWFESASWGYYDHPGDKLSDTIAAVSHILDSLEAREISVERAKAELADTVRPFVIAQVVAPSVPVVLPDSSAKKQPQSAREDSFVWSNRASNSTSPDVISMPTPGNSNTGLNQACAA